MTPKSKQALTWVGVVFGALGGLAIVGLAAAYWIHLEVRSQLTDVSIPDTTQITTDVEVIKSTVLGIDSKVNIAIDNQQRFEEVFIEYLTNEAN